MNNVTVLGIDLAKDVFQLHAVNEHGKRIIPYFYCRAEGVGLIVSSSNSLHSSISDLSHSVIKIK